MTGCGNQDTEWQGKGRSEGTENGDKGAGQAPSGDENADESEAPKKTDEPEEYVFVKEYAEAMNTAMKSGDASAMRGLSTEDCEGCNTLADFQEDLHEDGGKYLGDPSFEVVDLVQGPDGEDPTWVRIAKKQPKVDQIQEKGGPEKQVGGMTDYSEFGLIQEEGTWKVSEFCGVTKSQPQGCP